MCGAPLDVAADQTVAVCAFCGSKQTVANADDERKENLFNRANSLRQSSDFDKGLLAYQSILTIFPQEPEAHWGIVLCKYGIEYIDDSKTNKKIPTIHRVSYDSILKDHDYLAAISNADVIAREQYQIEAAEISEIQNNILKISQKEKPFDVFICYKETDAKGKRTPDSVMAQDIYNHLYNKGYKVFFARITLENKLGTMYEPYIFAALSSAKIMLVLGTKKEYFEATWVQNEWSRFLDMMKTRPDRYLIPCYKDMDAYEMPDRLLTFQAQDLAKLGFIQDLTRGIDKIMGRNVPETPTETKIIHQTSGVNIQALLTRAEILINDREYIKADEIIEQVLNNDPKNSNAYLLKLLIDLKVQNYDDLENESEPFDTFNNYQKAYEFGDDKQKEKLSSLITLINNRNEETRLNSLYNAALHLRELSRFKEAEEAFKEISHYKDAANQAGECLEAHNQSLYDKAISLMIPLDIYNLNSAYTLFNKIPGYRDVDQKIEEVDQLISEAENEKIYVACLINRKINVKYDAALLKRNILNLKNIEGYKDASELRLKYETLLTEYVQIVKNERKERADIKAKKIKKFKTVSLFSAIGALLLSGVLLLTMLFIVPESRQNNIEKLINAGDFDAALSLIEKNGDYGNAETLRSMVKAGKAFETLDYETGIHYIYSMDGFVSVTYDADGGNATKNSEVIQKQNRYIDNDSTKYGYNFFGWRQVDFSLNAKEKSAAITLVANYNPIYYDLTFNLEGGKASNLPTVYNIENSVMLPNPTRLGYTFIGWTSLNLSEPTLDYTIPAGSVGNKTFTANWTANEYRIYLNANGGQSVEYVDVTFDSNYSLPTPTYAGYDFNGWFDSNSDVYTSGKYTTPGDLYLSAEWDIISYVITYHLNGGSNHPDNPQTYVVTNNTYALKDPTRKGYSFTGWTNNLITIPTKGVSINKGTIGDLSFTANWQANSYDVTINPNGGSVSETRFTFIFNELYNLPEPTRAGYAFVNYIDQNDTVIAANGTWIYARALNLTAIWEANNDTPYVVNYYLETLEEGVYSLSQSTTKYGVSDSTVNETAHTFDGFTSQTLSQQVTIDANGSRVVDFYYTRNSYVLNFVTNGGVALDSLSLKFEQEIPDTTITTRNGYTFAGWYQNMDQTDSFSGMPATNSTAYAYYSEETKAQYFTYDFIDEEVSIVGNNDVSGFVTVPEYINDQVVTSIGDYAFESNANLTKIKLAKNIVEVGEGAFKDCVSLVEVLGTDNLTTIKDRTFEGCRSLSYFPNIDNVESIGDYAFKDCVSLTTISFSDKTNTIGNYAFSGCVSLLQTPDLSNVTSYGNYAFEGCSLLSNVIGLDGNASLGDGIFAFCRSLAKLSLVFQDYVEQFYVAKLFGYSELAAVSEEFYEVTSIDDINNYVPLSLVEIDLTINASIPDHFAYHLQSLQTIKVVSLQNIDVGVSAFEGTSTLR